VGYPGSGKTTASQIIHDLTGAVHIWADYERRVMFGEPTHSQEESKKLYHHLNQQTDMLLGDNQSVIFDTNFNFRDDRDLLRGIAAAHGAETRLVWVKVDKDIAKKRAMHPAHALDNKYTDTMKSPDFERITKHLEPPTADESPVMLDGTCLSLQYVSQQLGLPLPKHQRIATSPATPKKPGVIRRIMQKQRRKRAKTRT
jgi:predicted kinase